MSKSTAAAKAAAQNIYKADSYVKNRWLYYLAAFLIPAILTFIAYALFGVYPFGERSVLTLDLNGQYVYYFEAIRDAFWGGRSALYSWARNLSGGFQGVIGYYLASPFTFIVILLPRTMIVESLMIMQLCKVGACGVSFAVYAQKAKNVKPLQSVIFSTMYALMAFVAIQMIDPMWIDGPIFLPLIILGVEYLVDDGRKINYIIPLAIMFIANFYIGFMVAIFVAIYFFYYIFFGTKRKFKGIEEYIMTFIRMGIATVVVLMCSFIMIMPVYKALALGKFDFSTPDYSFRTMFNPIELLPTLLPNQYYSVNVDEGTRMYGRPEIYCGVLSFVLSAMYFSNKKIGRNRKLGYGLLLVVMFFSMWIKPINMMWHGGQDPNWLPYRYSFLISFILVAMASETFANLEDYKLDFKVPAIEFAVIAGLTFIFEAVMPNFNYNEERYDYVAETPYSKEMTINGETVNHLFLGTLVFGVILAAFYLTIMYLYSHSKSKGQKMGLSLITAAVVIFEAGYNCYDTILKIDKEVYYSSKPSYDVIMHSDEVMEELENYDSSFYRAEKTFFRSVNDNQAYGLKGISHSSSVMNTKIINFIETLGYTTKSYETRYDGNTPLADSLLGIKYVLNDPAKNDVTKKSLLSPTYNKVYDSTYINSESKEAALEVYENPDALAIGAMVNDDILNLSFLGNDNPFNSMNNFLSSLTGNTPDYSGILEPREYFYRLPEPEVELNECWESDYGGQHCYNANAGAGDPTVRIHITSESEDNLYMFLKSDNPKACNLWISDEKDENGNFINHRGFGQYYDGYNYSIVNLGSYPAGKEIEVRLTIIQGDKTGNNEYVMVKDFQFYHFNYELFHQDMQLLKQNEWQLDLENCKDNYLVGDIDAAEGQIMYTSIPYEPGWTIKVDGKTIDEQFTEDISSGTSIMRNDLQATGTGSVVILNALIGIRLPAGHHTVSMKYSPPGFNMGIILLILGIGVIIAFYLYDKKNNPVMELNRKAKERRKNGTPEPEQQEDDSSKKKVQIIKSKGAVAEKTLEPVKQNKTYEEDTDNEENVTDTPKPEKAVELKKQPESEEQDEGEYESADDAEHSVSGQPETKPETKKPANNQPKNTTNNSKKSKKKKKK